ncbi:FAD synthetase family protein [Salimicrobium flavidum]|uniref:FAD synthase n=1 Tax=Salimicrobium flavidum TaxID=570947 RepID=A0A1N7IK87_9BACI|nr:FAD synthetase family protein [Salimicrobium flavidum]SIS37495.1 riboflavin kinase / FMN adenylyltransferase [Salimicrobium flavidum]
MEVIRINDDKSAEIQVEESVVAVGFFDGLHTGHQRVILTAKEIAEKEGKKWGVMTFDPHPSVVLKGVEKARYLTPLPVKEKLIQDFGADYLFIVSFTKGLASLSPKNFVDEYFAGLDIVHIVAGYDFSFGHKGKGNMDVIDELAEEQFSTTTVKKVEEGDEKISSTRIRGLLDEGNILKVNELLGRPYEIHGAFTSAGMVDVPDYYHLPGEGRYEAEIEGETVSVKIRGSGVMADPLTSVTKDEVPIYFRKKL